MDSGERPPSDADDDSDDRAAPTGSTAPDEERGDAPSTPETPGEPDPEATAGADGRSAPDPQPGTDAARGRDPESPVRQFREADRGPLMWLREMVSSAVIVLAIGLLLFGVSGVWPPMVAVESGSMEPNMEKGDLIFVTEPGRFAPAASDNGVGVVSHEAGREAGYETFGSYGSVIVFERPNSYGPPIIHRARFYVEEGENWYDRADQAHLNGESCEEVRSCPAPHDGFITKGDNNSQYDQVSGLAPPVRTEWVTGVARVRVPLLGWVRLLFTGAAALASVPPGTALFAAGASAAAIGVRTGRAG